MAASRQVVSEPVIHLALDKRSCLINKSSGMLSPDDQTAISIRWSISYLGVSHVLLLPLLVKTYQLYLVPGACNDRQSTAQPQRRAHYIA